MSTPLLKLYKGSYESSTLFEKCTEGAIVFDNTTHRIYAGTADNKPFMFGSNIQDADFSQSVLKIWKTGDAANNPSITLNFSDIASASATMAVFQQFADKMGLDGTQSINYSGTNYLADLGTQGYPDKNLVNADKALDTAIKNVSDALTTTIQGLDSVADADDTTAVQGHATVQTSTPTTDFKVLNAITEEDGVLTSAEAYQLKKVAATAEAEDLAKSTTSTATYDTTATEISSSWIQTVQGNILTDGDTVDADLNKLDNKIAGLADELIRDERVINTTVNALANSIGLEDDFTLDLTSAQGIITSDTDVKSALIDLANRVQGISSDAVLDVQIQGVSITDSNGVANFNVEGTYDSTTNKVATESTVTNAIQGLDAIADADTASGTGYATITTETPTDDFKVLNAITEEDGKLVSGTAYNIKKVAATGAAADLSYTNTTSGLSATNAQSAIDELDTRIDAIEGSFDVIISTDAATTPYGVEWDDQGTTVTGTLVASADTWHKIYLVPSGSGKDSYQEYITLRSGAGTTQDPYVYSWEKLGNTSVDLLGYVKTVTVNGKSYPVDTNSTNVTLIDMITSITGETAISGGESDLVAVTATTTKTTADGTNATVLASSVKVEEVADGLTKDATPTYSADHYVIENGKLVSAVGKSTGDTYTISANDGLTKASDVKAYVTSAISDASFRWSEWS